MTRIGGGGKKERKDQMEPYLKSFLQEAVSALQAVGMLVGIAPVSDQEHQPLLHILISASGTHPNISLLHILTAASATHPNVSLFHILTSASATHQLLFHILMSACYTS